MEKGKMKKQFLVLGIVIILGSISLGGCESSLSDKIYGTWRFVLSDNTTVYETFFRNGSCCMEYFKEESIINQEQPIHVKEWSEFILTNTTIYYKNYTADYFFSTDYKKIVLIDIENKNVIRILERI